MNWKEEEKRGEQLGNYCSEPSEKWCFFKLGSWQWREREADTLENCLEIELSGLGLHWI